jgi:hypothetical protein
MLKCGLVSEADFDTAKSKIIHKDKRAMAWEEIVHYLVNLTQNRVLEEIKNGNFDNVNKLLLIPEAKTLQYIINNKIIAEGMAARY